MFPLPDEPVEQFIASLYNLAADCNFGELKGELIQDRIAVRIRDTSLSERLQMDPELMLEKAKTVIWQREAVREQQVTLKGDRLEAPQLLEVVGHLLVTDSTAKEVGSSDKYIMRHSQVLYLLRHPTPSAVFYHTTWVYGAFTDLLI